MSSLSTKIFIFVDDDRQSLTNVAHKVLIFRVSLHVNVVVDCLSPISQPVELQSLL